MHTIYHFLQRIHVLSDDSHMILDEQSVQKIVSETIGNASQDEYGDVCKLICIFILIIQSRFVSDIYSFVSF